MKRVPQAGFTLTEVLIGTAVLGLAIATFLISTRHALSLVEKADLELLAVRRAENLLVRGLTASGGARLVLIPSGGDLPPGLTLYRLETGASLSWYLEVEGGS